MNNFKQLQYAIALRKRNLKRISEELIWAGDTHIRSHDTLIDIAVAENENRKTDEEMLGRFIF